jgi:hypothetical protein
MQTVTSATTVGVFSSRAQADSAVDALFDAGFDTNEIGVVTRGELPASKVIDSKTTTSKSEDEAENAGIGAATGAAAGAGIGGLIGWGVLAGAIPVVGPAIFAGTMGILASNALGGAAVAGVVGALTGWGVSEEHAKHYESELAAGRVVVTVTSERNAEARSILRQYGATSKDPDFGSCPTV